MIWKCVEFAQAAISGLALLELAGVNSGQPPQVYDWGGGAYTVCQIDRQPTQVPDRCFGPTSGPNWSDWNASAGGWMERTSGVTGYRVNDGDLEGWTYSAGFGAPPPTVRFSQVCPPPSPLPAAHSASIGVVPAPTGGTAGPSPDASQTPAETPVLQALAPTASPTAQSALASAGPPPSKPGDRRTLLLLAVGVLLLGALAAWNLATGRGP